MHTAPAMKTLAPIEIQITQLASVIGGLKASRDERGIALGALRKSFPHQTILLGNVDSTPTIRSGINILHGGFNANMRHGTFSGKIDLGNHRIDDLVTNLE
jgi:hypothetical protein